MTTAYTALTLRYMTDTGAHKKDQAVMIRLDSYERDGLQQLANDKGLSLSRMVALMIRERLKSGKER